ncbi:MAG: arginine--tRNA ligase [Rickettsiales bacterium]|nr:arginine--tRNA ligase [Rickettsiales bacterium]|tara:strand:- start:947 stop:2686 length:1740 start_codon:yes stop_codon:yes gene_type:complete
MNNINTYYKSIFAESFSKIFDIPQDDLLNTQFTLENPKDLSHGDFSTNICMVFAQLHKINPLEAAEKITNDLLDHESFESIHFAKPGFINFMVKKVIWYKFLLKKLDTNILFNQNIGIGEIVNIEYVSANPTGPLHIGHCRGAVFGDVLANLLESTGFNVVKEYYINDAGSQIDLLAKSVILRIEELQSNKKIDSFPAELYPGEYLIDVAQSIIKSHGEDIHQRDDYFELVKSQTVHLLLEGIKSDLSLLSIEQNKFVSEKDLVNQGKIDQAINRLEEMKLIYQGELEKPKGKMIDDWEPREQMLFRSSTYGDEVDRPLQKSNGEWTYFANDIAYHFDKYQRGASHLIDIWGADHGGYIKRMHASIKALTDNKAKFTVKLCQMVKLISDGQQIKMSKRSGDFITLREMVERVGSDSIRFMMMYRKNEAPLEFDFQKVTEQSKDNPVFYVQYAHARISSVLRNLKEQNIDIDLTSFSNCDMSHLKDPSEILLIKKIMNYHSIVESAVSLLEPHRIAYYLYELASEFHSLWNLGKVDKSKKFIDASNLPQTHARIALLVATQRNIKSGLGIIGVSTPDEMK